MYLPDSIEPVVFDTGMPATEELFITSFKGHAHKKTLGLSRDQCTQLHAVGIDAYPGEQVSGGLVSFLSHTKTTLPGLYLYIQQSPYEKQQQLFDYIEQLNLNLRDTHTWSAQEVSTTYLDRKAAYFELGTSIIPSDSLSLIEKRPGFQACAVNLGTYVFFAHKENTHMFAYELNRRAREVEDSRDSLELLPARTPTDELFHKPDPYPKEGKYPQRKNTRRFNNIKAKESKCRLAIRLYQEIKVRMCSGDEKERKRLINHVKSLRPPMRMLRAYYVSRGDTPEHAAMLVTPENYPYLPNVWLTKKQQQALLAVLNHEAESYQEFIDNGFK